MILMILIRMIFFCSHNHTLMVLKSERLSLSFMIESRVLWRNFQQRAHCETSQVMNRPGFFRFRHFVFLVLVVGENFHLGSWKKPMRIMSQKVHFSVHFLPNE